MKNFLTRFIQKRIEKNPITNILKDSFGMVGGVYGFYFSVGDVFKYENGFIIRPLSYTAMGYSLGFVCGLYPYHCLGILVGGDAYFWFKKQQ